MLGLQSIVCAIYAKAAQIKYNNLDKFKPYLLMLGIFHSVMMYLGVIGKQFGDSGLTDLPVQSEVIIELSDMSSYYMKHYREL